jgi:hypothetical protein
MRAKTRKNVSFAYFIGINSTTLKKSDGIPHKMAGVETQRGLEALFYVVTTGAEPAID